MRLKGAASIGRRSRVWLYSLLLFRAVLSQPSVKHVSWSFGRQRKSIASASASALQGSEL
eukprot:2791219-Rhodomonas_salina.1